MSAPTEPDSHPQAGFVVFADGEPETGIVHDSPEDADDEAFLIKEQAPRSVVEVRGPGGYRKFIN